MSYPTAPRHGASSVSGSPDGHAAEPGVATELKVDDPQAARTAPKAHEPDAALAALAALNAISRAVLESSADAVFVYDATGRLVHANGVARERFRAADCEEPVSGAFEERAGLVDARDARTPDGHPYPQQEWGLPAILAGKTVRPHEAPDMCVRLADGSDALFAVSGTPIRGSEDAVTGAVCVLREVTEHRRIERESAERQHEIEAMVDTMTDAAMVYDAQGNLRRINQSALKLLGIEGHGDLRAHGLAPLQPVQVRSRKFVVRDEHGRPLPPEAWPQNRILRGERLEGPSAMDTLVRTLDGRDLRLNTTGAPIRDERGRITGALLIARDVSERRALERRTREALDALLAIAEELFAAPAETAHPSGALARTETGDDDGDLTLPTLRAAAQRLVDLTCEVLGCSRASLTLTDAATRTVHPLAVAGMTARQRRSWMRAFPEASAAYSLDKTQRAELLAGHPIVLERSQASKRGGFFVGGRSTLVVPLRVAGQVIGTITADFGAEPHDYTLDEIAHAEAIGYLCSLMVERERLLRDRAASEARALALEATKRRMDEFLGVVSHELRTPLTSIKANIQVTRRRLHSALFTGEIAATEQTRALPDLLVRAERQVMRLDTLVNDLLDVSRIQSGKLQLRPTIHDLLDVVTEAVQDERLAWPGRAIELANAERGVWRVEADGDRVRQVVTNYLGNALKYAPRDRPVTVRVQDAAGAARVSVTDDGPGIPEGEREQIWELFHQVPSTEHLNGSGVGLGLGLHICKTIIERHGGQVGVESEVGRGSTFWFTLPLLRS